MPRSIKYLFSILIAALTVPAAHPADDPCTKFTWDVKNELAVMNQSANAVTVATKAGASVPQLEVGKLYELQLAAQNKVTFAAKPAKPTLDDGGQAGLVKFKTDEAGRYRISVTSGHWIDVVDGALVIASRDFQGMRGCERPRKIVEYELAAARDLVLQLSGSTDAKITLAITQAPTP
ncbi:MAG TPA: hypothetical protein VK629_13335 [Steroidobacteraceae bacterium]|nr:hypothetical protein [Steroidobacteraceae bacterium]